MNNAHRQQFTHHQINFIAQCDVEIDLDLNYLYKRLVGYIFDVKLCFSVSGFEILTNRIIICSETILQKTFSSLKIMKIL